MLTACNLSKLSSNSKTAPPAPFRATNVSNKRNISFTIKKPPSDYGIMEHPICSRQALNLSTLLSFSLVGQLQDRVGVWLESRGNTL